MSRGLTAACSSASPGARWIGACYDRSWGAFKKHRLTCTLFVGLPKRTGPAGTSTTLALRLYKVR